MTIYLTSQHRESLYRLNPSDPVAAFVSMADAVALAQLKKRPAHDTREEIVVTEDPKLLDKWFEFDPKPSKDAR